MLFVGRLYIWGMKKDFSINNSAICTNVYMITANAAQQSGGTVNAATEDNEDVICELIAEGLPMVAKAFGRYLDNITSGKLTYSMPSNWGGDNAELADCVEVFLANYAVSRWYSLSGKEYANKADVAYARIKDILDKRTKPTR